MEILALLTKVVAFCGQKEAVSKRMSDFYFQRELHETLLHYSSSNADFKTTNFVNGAEFRKEVGVIWRKNDLKTFLIYCED